MRSRVVVLLVALGLGAVAAYLSAVYLNGVRVKAEADAQPVKVWVARQEIPAGSEGKNLIEQGLVEAKSVPRQYVAEGAISEFDGLKSQVLSAPLAPGEQLTTTEFRPKGQAGMSFAIPDGHVALAIPYDKIRGVSWALKAGDQVAVIATYPKDAGAKTKVILKDILVLDAGSSLATSNGQGYASQNSSSQNPGQQTLTLALTPREAERVVFAQENGLVWLALQKTGGRTPTRTLGVTAVSLFR